MKLLALLALLLCATPASAQSGPTSSPEERQRFVSVVHSLEQAPLDPALQEDRAWAFQWITDAPDLVVQVCMEPLKGAFDQGYEHFSQILFQYSMAMGAYAIENPTKQDDRTAQQLAGVESALKAYRSIIAARPRRTSPALDKLLAMQGRGELPGFVSEAYRQCLAKDTR